jgi:1-acyl-sn-glycerol-3-phosphate acyltransferase
VLPVAVTSARCWPRKSFVLRPGVIDVSIGKPIPRPGATPIR